VASALICLQTSSNSAQIRPFSLYFNGSLASNSDSASFPAFFRHFRPVAVMKVAASHKNSIDSSVIIGTMATTNTVLVVVDRDGVLRIHKGVLVDRISNFSRQLKDWELGFGTKLRVSLCDL
jgi:hypothetical protein